MIEKIHLGAMECVKVFKRMTANLDGIQLSSDYVFRRMLRLLMKLTSKDIKLF